MRRKMSENQPKSITFNSPFIPPSSYKAYYTGAKDRQTYHSFEMIKNQKNLCFQLRSLKNEREKKKKKWRRSQFETNKKLNLLASYSKMRISIKGSTLYIMSPYMNKNLTISQTLSATK